MPADTRSEMDRGIYTTATGMAAAEHMLDVVANNLANVNTNGFKQDGIAFDDLLRRQLFGEGGSGPLIGILGSGAAPYEQYVDFGQGEIKTTGNSLDFAISKKDAMFAIQTPNGIKYTRDGSFSLAGDNGNQVALVTKQGYPVLDAQQQPITFTRGSLDVDREGHFSIDGKPTNVTLGLFTGAFTKTLNGNGQFDGANVQPYAPDPATEGGVAQIIQGALEGSNVSTIASMVQMIALQRSYELSQKSIQSQDEQTQKLIGSLQ